MQLCLYRRVVNSRLANSIPGLLSIAKINFFMKGHKGQIKPKADLRAVGSPKKGTNKPMNLFSLLFCFSQQTNQICSFVFWKNLRRDNPAFRFIWPLVNQHQISPSYVVWKFLGGAAKQEVLLFATLQQIFHIKLRKCTNIL